jgi:glyoxylase-like metal-dependent hydrolase (beta-lactamase superfamily II)
VRGNGTMVWRDPFKVDGDQEIAAVVVDEAGHRHKLDAGTEWTVHLSPFDIRAAYISHHDRGYIGQARVLVAGTKWAPDQETIAAVKAAEADMRRTWETIGRRRLADDIDRRASNAAAMAAAGTPGQPARRETADARDYFAEVEEAPAL